jgi:hypothetical protein
MTTWPSLQANIIVISLSALGPFRVDTSPPLAKITASTLCMERTASCIDTSTSCPSPVILLE